VRQFVAHTDYEQLGGIVATAKAMVAAEPDSCVKFLFILLLFR
jgi:hypothetical protein